MLVRRPNVEEYQIWKLPIEGHDELLQVRNRHPKANAVHSITVLECEQYTLFIFGNHLAVFVKVVNDQGKGGRMCQHVRHRGAMRANKAKTQVE